MNSKVILCDIEGTTTSISFVKVSENPRNTGFPRLPRKSAEFRISSPLMASGNVIRGQKGSWAARKGRNRSWKFLQTASKMAMSATAHSEFRNCWIFCSRSPPRTVSAELSEYSNPMPYSPVPPIPKKDSVCRSVRFFLIVFSSSNDKDWGRSGPAAAAAVNLSGA